MWKIHVIILIQNHNPATNYDLWFSNIVTTNQRLVPMVLYRCPLKKKNVIMK